MAIEVRIPQLGESVTDGVIARWLKHDGDTVTADEPLLELETDKAAMEIPSPGAGRLEIVTPEGATVSVGAVVARITAAAETASATVAGPAPAAQHDGDGRTSPAPSAPTTPEPPLSPAVRKLVTEQHVDPARIAGTGKGGRVTKGDVLREMEEREARSRERRTEPARADVRAAQSAPPAPEQSAALAQERASTISAAPAREPTAPARPAGPAAHATDDTERVPMTPLRRRIAERLLEAQRTAAILTTFNEIDLSELVALRKRHRERFRERHGVDLGLMSLFGRAAILALGQVPVVNARIDGADIVYHRRVHLGIAVSTTRGLVVPVVRNADAMSLAGLERAIAELARVAREGKLTPDQLAGGTFSITNGGIFGSLLSTPILNPPQAGILGMHRIQERPVAVQGQVVVRPMMYVALSYDHRLVDGEQAVTFLVRVKEQIEDPTRMLLDV